MIEDVISGAITGQGTIHCPFHRDRHPSARYYPDGGFHCFSCGAHARDRVDLLRQLRYSDLPYGLGRSFAKAELDERGVVYIELDHPCDRPETPSVAIDAMTAFSKLAADHLAADRDLTNGLRLTRGVQSPAALGLGLSDPSLITPTAQSLQALGYAPDEISLGLEQAGLMRGPRYLLSRRIIIPEIREQKAHFYQARLLRGDGPKYLNPPISRVLFGLRSLSYDKPYVVITEGAFDALPLIEVGVPALALLGTQTTLDPELFSNRQVVLGLDQDEAGQAATRTLQQRLTDEGVESVILPPPPPHKDYGAWLATQGSDRVISEIEWSR